MAEHPTASSAILPSEAVDTPEPRAPEPFQYRTNLLLFLATLVSVFFAGAHMVGAVAADASYWDMLRAIPKGYAYAVPLMAILLTHEFGHYFAARYHKVDASLPYFIPLPQVSLLGTMGAVIAMRGRIKSRAALLDIGASGPLAGMVVAVPVLVIGLLQSSVEPISGHGLQEGQSLLYWFIKRVTLGPIPDGYDVFLSPMAFAGWCGLLVTALNLLPVGQLDGGHIAYALFGERQDRYARWLHYGLLPIVGYNLLVFVGPVLRAGGDWSALLLALSNSLFWLFWFGLLFVMYWMSGRKHPPTEPGTLSTGRRVIAIASLVLFLLLFMPTPMATY